MWTAGAVGGMVVPMIEPGVGVVVPLDESDNAERALGPAADLAARVGGRVHLVSVVENDWEAVDTKRYLERVAAALVEQGAEVSVGVTVGPDPVAGILAAVPEVGVLCLATGSRIHLHDSYIGSVAEEVVRRSGRATVLVGPHVEAGQGFEVDGLVVPVDGSTLATEALAEASGWAEVLGLPLRVLGVVSTADEVNMELAMGAVADQVEAGYLERLVSDHVGPRVDVTQQVAHGDDAAAAIVDAIGDRSIAVLATHGRSGLERIARGSVTADVVRRSTTPVVVVCPSSG